MTASARAAQPSHIVLPVDTIDKTTVFAFLVQHFSRIGEEVWRQRILDGKVHWRDGSLIALDTEYRPVARVYYYREVPVETKIPFVEQILFQDDNIILAYKPHFLPVTPSGNYVNECLVHRLRLRTGIDTIAPAHRLDRETAGVILMTVSPETRARYHQLFIDGAIRKDYQAIAKLTPDIIKQYQNGSLTLPLHWTIKNRMQPSEPSFTMEIVTGEANTHSEIGLVAIKGNLGLFHLSPITGKTHQLRVHMQSLAMPLLNDRFYPNLLDRGPDNFAAPLKLMAQRLRFIDPVSGISHDIQCEGFAF
ncbi:pseudouridine synthase [Shewanella glacialipiscicola]|uniref:pseudouridine synthase n=1 Tax=Shewanella glacialipiscicola TaxID=614069 RepID=UPI0021D84145|nr:pseudouridine synthase [Shewanella glacialipiscicola]MCU7996620.1 pseudouridine synthase [Shewanella glacialipiscicola]MCU8027933.1 pseudouridine synthase [Shewanella glacialipiscicola]